MTCQSSMQALLPTTHYFQLWRNRVHINSIHINSIYINSILHQLNPQLNLLNLHQHQLNPSMPGQPQPPKKLPKERECETCRLDKFEDTLTSGMMTSGMMVEWWCERGLTNAYTNACMHTPMHTRAMNRKRIWLFDRVKLIYLRSCAYLDIIETECVLGCNLRFHVQIFMSKFKFSI